MPGNDKLNVEKDFRGMQNFMRKHRRAILVFILLFIAVPFIFVFGNPWRPGQTQNTFEDRAIAEIGDVPILASEYRKQLDAAAQRAARGGERPTYEELAADGTADEIFENLVDQAFINMLVNQRDFQVQTSHIEDRMKEWELFQDEDGNFNPKAWNDWVREREEQGMEWDRIYKDFQQSIGQQTLVNSVLARAGRVFDREIEEQLEEDYTTLRIKYAKIEPPVELSEEEIRQHYEENREQYKTPDQRVARFVSISLEPEIPELAYDLAERARGGADFAELANAHSELPGEKGGDMGWQTPRENLPDFRKPLFEMEVGEVSDPIRTGTSVFIYKVEEERTNEESGQREVRARQILLRTELSEEEREQRTQQAEQLAEKARELKDLQAAAAEMGFELETTDSFSTESEEIAGVPKLDVRAFRNGFNEEQDGGPIKVITGSRNIYVAKVDQVILGTIPPFEAVKDQVREDAIAAHKQTDEYKARVAEYAEKIEEQADSLEEAARQFPELNLEVKESSEFKPKDYFLQKDNVFLQPSQIYEAVGEEEPGTMGGPLSDFQGNQYFFELLEKTPPTEEDKEKWAEEREKLVEQETRRQEFALFEDWKRDLRERMMKQTPIRKDPQQISQILGLEMEEAQPDAADGGDDAIPAADPAEDESAAEGAPPAEEGATEKPAAEEAPAEEASPEETQSGEAAANETAEGSPPETETPADEAPAAETPAQ